jgi:hypothetical protein
MARVCILDYGSGNVRSVFNLFRGACEHVIISNLVADIATATHLVLPGVGAFGAAMRRIGDTIPIAALRQQVLENGKPFLGICGSDFRMWAGTTFACSRGHAFLRAWVAGRTSTIYTASHCAAQIRRRSSRPRIVAKNSAARCSLGTSSGCSIAEYLSDELLSPAAIELASSAYQDEIKRGLKDAVAEAAPDAKLEQIAAEEAQLRAMLKAGRLSADILKAALEALEQKRRRVLTLRERPRAAPARIIPLVAERYRAAVRNIAKHLGRSDQAPEARTLVRELLGGQGTVFVEGGKIGARFAMAGLIELATETLSNEINDYKNGSGVMLPSAYDGRT